MVLVTTYTPAHDVLRNITQKNWDYLGKSPITLHLHQKKIMVGYRRPKNLRDLLVKADCSLPKNYKVPAQTEARQHFLRGSDPPPLAPSQRVKQSSMTDYINRNASPQITIQASTLALNVSTITKEAPIQEAAIIARRLGREQLRGPKDPQVDKPKNVVLVTTFTPAHVVLHYITQKNWDYLGKSPIILHLHQNKNMVGYRRPKNLRDLLVKADCSLPKNYKVPA